VDEQKAKKAIIFGQYGTIKVRLEEIRQLRGVVTGRVYLWHKPGMSVIMDRRDYDAAFPPEKVKQQEVTNGKSSNT